MAGELGWLECLQLFNPINNRLPINNSSHQSLSRTSLNLRVPQFEDQKGGNSDFR